LPSAPTITTARLRLRPPVESDVPLLARILAEPPVARFWPSHDEASVREDFVEGDEDLTVFVIEHEGRVAGLIQFSDEDDPQYRHATVDLFVGTAFQGRGLGREAIAAVIDHLFGERGHHRIVIDPAAHNARAIAVYESVGFRRVGVMRDYERGADGTFHDGVLLEIVRADWRSETRERRTTAVSLRVAGPTESALVVPMMEDFNRGEGIELAEAAMRAALARLLSDRSLGVVWLLEVGGESVGYAVLTFGYDLEFAGRDAFITELYVRPSHRRRGVAFSALAEIDGAARALGVHAIHLGVRPENRAAFRLYESAGYSLARQMFLSKRL
jgi:aminoglycoside 6'-N-acetyltransferase